MKIELTIKTSYLPGWGVFEGIRELLQNGQDAQTEFGAILKVDHVGQTLRIENEGCVLPYEALLLGHTTKADRSDLIGQFGEGLKLGLLALVRAGRTVKIRSGSEVWTPFLTHSDKFKAEVLAFDIQGGREDKKRVRVEIGGVNQSEWQDIKEKFLFLAPPKRVVDTYEGALLLDTKYQGRLYVKGIYVQTNTALSYGYNIKNIAVDRDRKMVNSWDAEYATRKIWTNAVSKEPSLMQDFLELVNKDAADVKSLDSYATNYMNEEVIQKALDAFVEKYGHTAIPVKSVAEATDLEHLGKKGVLVSSTMQALLSKMFDLNKIRAALQNEAVATYQTSELSEIERANLQSCFDLLWKSGVIATGTTVKVVDFRSDNLLGQYKDGQILIAKRLLVDKHETLVTLVHEVSHAYGGDGEKSHIQAIENAWKAIMTTIWE